MDDDAPSTFTPGDTVTYTLRLYEVGPNAVRSRISWSAEHRGWAVWLHEHWLGVVGDWETAVRWLADGRWPVEVSWDVWVKREAA